MHGQKWKIVHHFKYIGVIYVMMVPEERCSPGPSTAALARLNTISKDMQQHQCSTQNKTRARPDHNLGMYALETCAVLAELQTELRCLRKDLWYLQCCSDKKNQRSYALKY